MVLHLRASGRVRARDPCQRQGVPAAAGGEAARVGRGAGDRNGQERDLHCISIRRAQGARGVGSWAQGPVICRPTPNGRLSAADATGSTQIAEAVPSGEGAGPPPRRCRFRAWATQCGARAVGSQLPGRSSPATAVPEGLALRQTSEKGLPRVCDRVAGGRGTPISAPRSCAAGAAALTGSRAGGRRRPALPVPARPRRNTLPCASRRPGTEAGAQALRALCAGGLRAARPSLWRRFGSPKPSPRR